ncbi:MAG: transcriptional regulator, AraC family [Caulobacter sp.]|nr:transcriptional regulator, AraC family [Caulobacter sp.]
MGQFASPIPTPRTCETLVVSHELTILVGGGPFDSVAIPEQAVALAFAMGAIGAPATLEEVGADGVGALLARENEATRIILLIAPGVYPRLSGAAAPAAGSQRLFHLPSDLRAIALALRDTNRIGEAADIYRSAKAIELIAEALVMLASEGLVPMAVDGQLSRDDAIRIVSARRLIEERWNQKLSLDGIASHCGLNREKLSRGFKEMFGATVAEAIAEQRLQQASRMLLTTDLPVSLVGYENGYLNNASFARAFGRRFGASPSDFRARELAA